MILGSVKDERTFSTMSFMKDKLQNKLSTHLPLVVDMHSQQFFTLENFPYNDAFDDWKKVNHREELMGHDFYSVCYTLRGQGTLSMCYNTTELSLLEAVSEKC
jgi:hypothetical protein